MTNLIGTEKQIVWATDIRNDVIGKIEKSRTLVNEYENAVRRLGEMPDSDEDKNELNWMRQNAADVIMKYWIIIKNLNTRPDRVTKNAFEYSEHLKGGLSESHAKRVQRCKNALEIMTMVVKQEVSANLWINFFRHKEF